MVESVLETKFVVYKVDLLAQIFQCRGKNHLGLNEKESLRSKSSFWLYNFKMPKQRKSADDNAKQSTIMTKSSGA